MYHEAPLGPYDTRFVVWAKGEHLLIRARPASDAERPVPGCVMNEDQTRQLLAHLQPRVRFSLEGISGAVELFTWGNLHLQNAVMDGTSELGMTSYDLRDGHDGLAKLIRRAMKDRTRPEQA